MKVPIAWLREFVPIELPVDELAERLTMAGVKVEGILWPWAGLENVVVARVLEVRDHPNSEKLCLARVDTGSGELEVVVGVRNMVAGDLVPLAPPGSRIPVLDQPLGQREIRGVISNGMLCSPRELNIGSDHNGILILDPAEMSPGMDLKSSLGLDDAVLDIEVEPNRPDFLSIIGIARETAAITGQPLLPHPSSVILGDDDVDLSSRVPVRIDAQSECPRYLGRVLEGVDAARQSPLVVQARLAAAGMRPISAVVDATNYVMLELGQPLHAFDMGLLDGPGIVVRRAVKGEGIKTLDDVDREMVGDELLICDINKPVAIAGVMGGATSEVSSSTNSIFLESAHFERTGILRTARHLELHSEASHRFERGVDPEAIPGAAARAASLIAQWTGGQIVPGVTEAGATWERCSVSMRPARATALIGYPISKEDTLQVFASLGMSAVDEGETVSVEVPGYRFDIEREVDLIEEVARIQGYDKVGSTVARPPQAGGVPAAYGAARLVKDALVRAGLREVRPVPFASSDDIALFDGDDPIVIANPLRAEEGLLRTHLLPGLLHTVARNQDAGSPTVAIFEVGTVFSASPSESDAADHPTLVGERRKVAFAIWGSSPSWPGPQRELDASDATGALSSLMDELGISDWSIGDAAAHPFHPGRSGVLLISGQAAGVVGEIHPRVAAGLGIQGRVAVAEFDLAIAIARGVSDITLADVPRFPPLRRDLAFIVADSERSADMMATILESGSPTVATCQPFDVYRGPGVPDGQKSIAFALEFRAPDKTLSDDEAQEVVAGIVASMAELHGAVLRA